MRFSSVLLTFNSTADTICHHAIMIAQSLAICSALVGAAAARSGTFVNFHTHVTCHRCVHGQRGTAAPLAPARFLYDLERGGTRAVQYDRKEREDPSPYPNLSRSVTCPAARFLASDAPGSVPLVVMQ